MVVTILLLESAMDVIFQASDLVSKRREILNAARDGRAHIRDTDGTELVALRAGALTTLEALARWSNEHRRLRALFDRTSAPTVADLGESAWLRAFEQSEREEFVAELQDALIAAFADNSTVALDECLGAWRITAQQLEDPLRRAVLTGRHDPRDFADAGHDVEHQGEGV